MTAFNLILNFLYCWICCKAVTYPPSFIEMPPENAVFIPSEAIRLPCVATGAPSPRYVWYKNGKEFNWAANTGRYTKWPDQGTLIMARPGTDDDGLYQCFAINQFGVAQSVVINVKRAEMGDFEPTQEKSISSPYGRHLVLPCSVPLGYPPPDVTWQTEKNAEIQYIKETNRRATNINGFLYIAAVNRDDDDTLYTCVANNEVLRHQKNGPSYRIKVNGQQTNYPLTELYRTPRIEVVTVGSVLQLKCIFGGNPEPQYTWFKDGKEPIELPNVIVQNLGTMLEINPVTVDAAGEYRCQGMNELTPTALNVQYAVHVNVPPKFIEKPSDITVPVNGTVIFKCTASGTPPPQIRWTVNGLDPSDYLDGVRKVLRGNVMELYNLTVKDIAVVQCNASNAFGYAFTNAFVNVMREPPFFTRPPQEEHRVVDGQEVTVYCETFSAPKAIISWAKNGRPINGGRYQSRPNGNLYIASVAITDSGVYECTATNPFGSRKASGRLHVRRRTSIVLAPHNTQVYEGQVVKFVCTAETDPTELDNLKINWYKDGNLIMPELTPRIQRVWFDYSLVLSGAEPRDTGQYGCNATNGLDFVMAEASLLVQGKPEQPLRVGVNCVDFKNEDLALVTWYPGSDNYSPIMEYIVEYSTQYERDTWYPAEIFNYTGLVHSTSIKVVLRPAILYQFRVRTRNRVGVSLPSKPTQEECQIPAELPRTNPRELYIYGTMRNNLILQWTIMPYIEHYGSSLGYILKLNCLDCDGINSNRVNTTEIGDWRTDRITFDSFRVGSFVAEIETFKHFRATIQSRNEKGASTAPPTEAFGYSGEALPTISPPAPTVISPTGRGAHLQWPGLDPAQKPQLNGLFRGYRVEWCDAALTDLQCSDQLRFQDVILRIPTTPMLYSYRRRRSLEGLFNKSKPSMSQYTFHSEDNSITHRERPLGRNAVSICQSTAERNISCPGAGTYPRVSQSPSVLGEAYVATLARVPRQVTPFSIIRGSSDLLARSWLPRATDFKLGDLVNYTLTSVPGATSIRLWLRFLNTRFAGPRSPIIELTTLEDTPGPIYNLKADSISVNYLDISWTPPSEPNGNITGYEVEAMELNQLDMGYGFRYPRIVNQSATGYRLARLKPNTTYRISVWPMTSAGIGVDNFIDITTLPSDVAPVAPSFVITTIGVTNMTVLYEPSHIGPPGTVFFVQYRQPGVAHWSESPPTFIDRVITVENLLSSTYYEVRMVATNGALLSSASASRQVHTLGGPAPGSLAGASGTWFIIVCVLLLFFISLFILLILLRKRRLRAVQYKAMGPTPQNQASVLSPDYAQPNDKNILDESARLISPGSSENNFQGGGWFPVSDGDRAEPQESRRWLPRMEEEEHSQNEDSRYDESSNFYANQPQLPLGDSDPDLLDTTTDDPLTTSRRQNRQTNHRKQRPFAPALRSKEEEVELESNSYLPSDEASVLESEFSGRSPMPTAPRYSRGEAPHTGLKKRGPQFRRRDISPDESSAAHSHISGDPTLI